MTTLVLATLTGWAGNRIFTENVRSLTSIVNGDWMNRPVMELGSGDRLRIGFDELSHDYHRFVYHLEHCEADWTVSDGLFESDWLVGFNDNPIENYQNSINTTVMYTHYWLTIPNDRCIQYNSLRFSISPSTFKLLMAVLEILRLCSEVRF